MATNVTRSQATSAGAAAQVALAKEPSDRRAVPSDGASAAKPVGYGLPCANCHLYYPANLDTCPTCKHSGRVSPAAPKLPTRRAQSAPEPPPDNALLEKEREEFLRQFKSQLLEAHAQVAVPDALCKFAEHHPGKPVAAEVCTSCYERLQERLDVCEASLHIDLKEAAQIVYDAVWADPSDPSKTYQNAAGALLAELRKRAGITAVLGPFQPLKH